MESLLIKLQAQKFLKIRKEIPACVSILVKLQAEKIHKTRKKTPVPPDFRFNKAAAGGTISTSCL